MPGILVMNHTGYDAAATPRDGETKKRDYDGRLVNGDRNDRSDTPAGPSTTNRVSAKNTATNGASTAVAAHAGPTLDQYSQLPPEIAHIPMDQYNALSVMLERMSQQAYNDLTATLSKMADLPLAPATNGLSNGLASHGASGQENAEINKRKKLLLLKFAQESRSKFIKLLVLTEWGKKAALDVSKLIDLFSWTREQSDHMNHVDRQLERIKYHSNSARENNPDINTALEILSTGKADWMPHLDYISPEPISSTQALKLLRYMNTSLSIRLNLHESLPRHLRNWRIHSGRVTFIIENSFEFDVISFVEDASEQWLFIDLRLLFTPAPTITIGSRFFMQIKAQADFVLSEKGLTGLFDFLHNFILTHKISVLRSQALSLARGAWAGSLKVEPVHRELVVQYWTNRPGKKNWIDIGLSSNKPKSGKVSWRGSPIPSLTMRWFRHGKEVGNFKLSIDWNHLSMERIVNAIIAHHTADILRSIKSGLSPGLSPQAKYSDKEPADCSLNANLGSKTNSISLSIEPVTGAFRMQPANAVSTRAENAFNRGLEPAHMGRILTSVLAQALSGSIQRFAQQLGWQPVARQSLQVSVVKAAVKLDFLEYALYWPHGWSSKWTFATIIEASGESWWIFELDDKGTSIEYAEQIRLDRQNEEPLPMDRAMMASLERIAVQIVSFRVTARKLEKEKKLFQLRTDLMPQDQSLIRRWALHLQTTDLLKTRSGENAWLEPNVSIVCDGLSAKNQTVRHLASGRMVMGVAADMQKLMATSQRSNFSFSEDGSFKISLSTPFGHDILGELRARLRDINRLRSFATTLQKRQMRLGRSSLQRVTFQYGPSSSIATVNFGSEKEISLEMSPKNPQYRILGLLTDIANERTAAPFTANASDANGLDRFCTTLILTRSVLKVLQELESHTPGNINNPKIHAHAVFKYRLTYANPVCSFDVRLMPKEDRVYWFIEDNFRTRGQDTRPTPERGPGHRRLEELQTKLKVLFCGKGDKWFGTRTGIVAELDGAAEALGKLHECVLTCKMEGGYKAPPPLEQRAATKAQAQAQALSHNQQSNGPPHPTQQQQQQMQQQRMQQQMQQGRNQQQQAQRVKQQQHLQRQQQAQQNQRSQAPGVPNMRPAQPPQQGRAPLQQQQKQARPGQSQNNVIEID
ncbi:mediator complex subunit [Coniothyrium glycines]